MLGAIVSIFGGVALMLVAGACYSFQDNLEDCIVTVVKICLIGAVIVCIPLLIPVIVIWWAMKEFMGQI